MRLAKVRKKTDGKEKPAEKKVDSVTEECKKTSPPLKKVAERIKPEPEVDVAVEKREPKIETEAHCRGNDARVSYSDAFTGDGWSPEDIPAPPKPRKQKTEAGREKQLVALAVDLAEKQLREGTASAQVITHYLKLGTEREKLEREILKEQRDLITEKTKALKSAAHMEELYAQAIEAMKTYGGGTT